MFGFNNFHMYFGFQVSHMVKPWKINNPNLVNNSLTNYAIAINLVNFGFQVFHAFSSSIISFPNLVNDLLTM